MTTLPASGYWENNARTEGEGKQWGEDVRDVIAELLGGSVPLQLTIASGVVVPTMGVHSIETEASAAADDLTNITTTNTPDGRFLLISAYNAAHVVTVKHAAGGAGQIHLFDSADATLNAPYSGWILLIRLSADWYEVYRSFHGTIHERGGNAEIDGDHLDIDYTPTHSVPATTPAEAANVDDLAAHLFGVDVLFGHFAKGYLQRSQFTYNGGAVAYTIKCKPAVYWCKDKLCQWITELTTTAIGTPAADDWYYLYLDYSEITNGTTIVSGKLIWSNTEPAWNNTYMGWYNGDDRCIMAVRTNSGPTNILEFFHDGGDEVVFADHIADISAQDVDTSWVDAESALSIPKFATKAQITANSQAPVSDVVIFYWRTNGQTGNSGHLLLTWGDATLAITINTTIVMTDSSQLIELKCNTVGTDQINLFTDGWYFPNGM